MAFFFFQAEDGIRDGTVTGVQRVLFRSTGLTWTIRKREIGLKETGKLHKHHGHFDYRKTKRQWKGKQEQLIDTIRSL